MSSKIGDAFKSFDMYGKTIGFTMQGSGSYKTYFGALVTSFVFIMCFAYSGFKLDALYKHSDVTHGSRSVRLTQ